MNHIAGVKKKSRHVLTKALAALTLISLAVPGVAMAAGSNPLDGLKVSLQGFAEYSAGQKDKGQPGQSSYNKFNLTRGYVTLKKSINSQLAARVTTDIHQLSTGDWEVRLKYLYGEVKVPSLGFLTNMKSEIGQGHTPWLDFEEALQTMRAQGPTVTDKGGFQTSADIGVDLMGYFGGKLADAKAKVGNSHYDGRYGSWHIGVYNGAGYHASEQNQNKVAEARMTVRPLAAALPGLELSYMGAFGKGNTKASPDYNLNLGMVSFQHPDFIVYGIYFHSKGNFKGSLVDANGKSLNGEGYTAFALYRLPVLAKKLAVFGRYDHVNDDASKTIAKDADYSMTVGGLSYDLPKGNKVLVDYEKITYGANSGGIGKSPVVANNLGDDQRLQLVYQFQF